MQQLWLSWLSSRHYINLNPFKIKAQDHTSLQVWSSSAYLLQATASGGSYKYQHKSSEVVWDPPNAIEIEDFYGSNQ